MKRRPLLVSYMCLAFHVCLAGLGAGLWAQQAGDPLGDSLFPPELVMQHQQAIGLTEEQKSFFKNELRQAQMAFTELQWKLQDEMEKLVSMVKQARVDEPQASAQLEKVLTLERDIKRKQLTLLIRIKNQLTAEQQGRLQQARGKATGKD